MGDALEAKLDYVVCPRKIMVDSVGQKFVTYGNLFKRIAEKVYGRVRRRRGRGRRRRRTDSFYSFYSKNIKAGMGSVIQNTTAIKKGEKKFNSSL